VGVKGCREACKEVNREREEGDGEVPGGTGCRVERSEGCVGEGDGLVEEGEDC